VGVLLFGPEAFASVDSTGLQAAKVDLVFLTAVAFTDHTAGESYTVVVGFGVSDDS
jgi:hypothetical protein